MSHFLAYWLLTFLSMLNWPARGWRVALGLAAFGAGIEGIQSMLDAREGSVADAGINCLGVASGLVDGLLVRRGWRKPGS